MSENSTSYFLTLLRHGESEANASGVWQGHSNSPLTDNGKAQARALCAYWREQYISFDAVISSPLARAFDTAKIVSDHMGLLIEKDPDWMERDIGLLAGSKRSEHMRFPISTNLYEPLGETGESEQAVFLRAVGALQNLLVRPPGKYLVVSHGGFLNRVMGAALAIAPDSLQNSVRFAFGNTGYASLEYRVPLGSWLVKAVNVQNHLANHDSLPVWKG